MFETGVPDSGEGHGFELRHQYEKGGREIIVRCDRDSKLDAMLEAFETFLKAIGYSLPGPITCEEELSQLERNERKIAEELEPGMMVCTRCGFKTKSWGGAGDELADHYKVCPENVDAALLQQCALFISGISTKMKDLAESFGMKRPDEFDPMLAQISRRLKNRLSK